MSTEEISQIDIFDGNDDNIEEKVSSSSPKAKTSKANSKPRTEKKILTLPLSRVRQIMKTDTDCTIIAYDAVFLVAKATVMIFIRDFTCLNLHILGNIFTNTKRRSFKIY